MPHIEEVRQALKWACDDYSRRIITPHGIDGTSTYPEDIRRLHQLLAELESEQPQSPEGGTK